MKHEWGTEPDEAGRAFLRSVPPLKMPPEPRQTAPDALVSWEEWRAHVRLIETEMLGSKQPPPEPPRYVRRELGNGWVTHTIKILERPSPAENARRYTDEDGTW